MRLQLRSLLLVATQLASGGGSPLLPATQAALQAATAKVVAAEVLSSTWGAAPLPTRELQSQPLPADEAPAAEPQPHQLPAWLSGRSAGLAVSSAVCRASLLSTTAALARLSQPHQQQLQAGPAAAGALAGVALPVAVEQSRAPL